MKGTLIWKVLRGKTYLFKKLDAKGNGRVIGLRVPATTAAVLRVLHQAGLLGRNVIVVGTNALYAYEAAGGGHFDSSVVETGDVLWEARSRLTLASNVRGAGLIGLLRQADRSFEPTGARSFRAANRDGFMVDLLKPLPKDVIRDAESRSIGADDDLYAAATRNLAWLLSAKKFHQTAIARDGFPVPMVAPDPRLFALHKLWLAEQPDREPLKKGRDRAQGDAVLALLLERLPQNPLDPRVLKGLPAAARAPKLKVPRHI